MANERSHTEEEISEEELDRKFFANLVKEAVYGNVISLKGHNRRVLAKLEKCLDTEYGDTFAQLKQGASPDQKKLLENLNRLRRASNSVRDFLGYRRPGTALRLDDAPVAPGAPMPSKGNR